MSMTDREQFRGRYVSNAGHKLSCCPLCTEDAEAVPPTSNTVRHSNN